MNRKDFVHKFDKAKIEEFSHMSVRERLDWIEHTNEFINKTIGLEKRAEWDERFEVFLDKKK